MLLPTLLSVCLAALSLCGCYYNGYEGEHVALYTEAVNSLLGINGFFDDPSLADSKIEILETDANGRVMYGYLESNIIAVLIAQKSDAHYIYYYPDFNFISNSEPKVACNVYNCTECFDEYVKNHFTEENIKDLKELNDFSKPFNEDKCVKKQISKKHEEPKLSKKTKADLDALCKTYAKKRRVQG